MEIMFTTESVITSFCIHAIMIAHFGTVGGKDVDEIILDNGTISCSVLTYGCILRTLNIPDRDGNPVDVVLGYDGIDDYRDRSGRLGAVIGRFANRISNASFPLNGRVVRVTENRPPNHIHGGNEGFDRKIWVIEGSDDDHVVFAYTSEDGEEGYPGRMDVRVTYSLEAMSLSIRYEAVSDSDTVCNLTNHSYFNLGGGGDITDHKVSIGAGRYTPSEAGIPTGEIAAVSGRMDLRGPKVLGDVMGDGYDDNYLLDPGGRCECSCGRTGIAMAVETDMPAVQFYTGGGLKDGTSGKNGRTIGRYSGLCFETQFCPDSPNHPNFPSSVLRKGERYDHLTVLRFRNDYH